ncbi:MAG: DNA internalization-related competence protein ComEC/Rec2 [Longimicrobiales bacterium]
MRAPLVLGVFSVAAGIAAGAQRSVSSGDGPLLLWVALAGAAVGAFFALGRRAGRLGGSGAGAWVLLFLAGGLLGATARLEAHRSCAARLPADFPLAVHGSLTDRSGDRLVLAATHLALDGVRVPCVGPVPARFDGPIPASGGLVARGRWWQPPGGSGMRPVGLLLVDALEPRPADTMGAEGGRGPVTEALAALRSNARGRVDALFGDRAPLAASLLLAQRDGLDREVRDRFARAGLSHLLAISGLHVALVAGILLLLVGALRLGKGAGSAVAGLGTLGYVMFLGAPHSATRAALQILLVLGARAAQRPARTEALIAAAALLLLAVEPGALFQPGFQLSFAGVGGILVLRRPLLRRMGRLAKWRLGGAGVGRWLADGTATSVAATLATAPIVAWHFGRVAPVGIVANLVAIPLLSAVVPALALALLAGLFWPPAGAFLAGAGAALLDALDATAGAAAGVPGGAVVVAGSVALVLTAAVVVGYVVSARAGRTRTPVRVVVWAGVAVAVLMVAPVRPGSDAVEIHVIDVGQGDAIGIRSPAGRWLLVDAGVAREGYDAGARLVVPYLSRRGVVRLEGLILTHPDADHVGGAGAVVASLRPRWVADPGMPAPKAGYLALLHAAAEERVPWVPARRGMALEVDGMTVDVLYPDGAVESDDANHGSVVLRVVFGEFEALLTGDAPAEVERALVRRYGRRLAADVLKLGHHGSSTSTTPELLTASGAALALVSAGRGNRYGHPHPSVIERLEAAGVAVARTDRNGSIVVRGTAGGGMSVTTERGRVEWR